MASEGHKKARGGVMADFRGDCGGKIIVGGGGGEAEWGKDGEEGVLRSPSEKGRELCI